MSAPGTLSDDLLQQLIPMDQLSRSRRALLFEHAELQPRRRGTDLLAEADLGRNVLYLIEGQIELQDPERGRIRIEAGSDVARLPLFPLLSMPDSAKALTAVTLLRCDRAWLDSLMLPPLLLPFCHSREHTGADAGDWLQQLLQTRLFQELPTPSMQQLFSRAEPLACGAGQTVIRQGEHGDCFYIIQSGSCEVAQLDSNEKVIHTFAELGAGSWFGEVPLLSDTLSSVNITMRREGALLRIDRETFNDLVRTPLVKSMDSESAQSRADSGARWLDVREPVEFEAQHRPAALNCRLADILANRTPALRLGQHYIVCCDSGRRSAIAAWLLALRGYTVSWLRDSASGAEYVAVESTDPAAVRTDPLLRALRGELTRLLQQVDTAMRIKHEAEDARREAERVVRTRLDEERSQLDEQAVQVRNMLTQTQQLQQRLVHEKDKLYAGLRERERAIQERVNSLNEYIEARVTEERERLEAHYRDRESEIQRLQQEKADAESRLQTLQAGSDNPDCATGSGASGSVPGNHDELEQEFMLYDQALRIADQERAHNRAAQTAMSGQMHALMNELGHQAPTHIDAARERLQRRREALESNARKLNVQVEQTLLEKQATHAVHEALQREAEELGQQGDETSGDDANVIAARAQAEVATDRYNRAEQAHATALAAKERNDADLAEANKAEQELLQELNVELETWLKEEAKRPRSLRQQGLIRNYEETMQRLQEEAANAEENERTHDHLLLSEINAALEDLATKK